MVSSTIRSLGRALAYRASSLRRAGSARSAYQSFKSGLISAADSILASKDPVFAFLDWEALGAELKSRVTVPVTDFARSTTLHEKLCLGVLLTLQEPKVILELGTFQGATTRLLFENASPETRLYSVDIPSDIDTAPGLDRTRLIDLDRDGLEDGLARPFFPRSERATQLYADLTRVDWAHLRRLPPPDFVLIDANHAYDACLRDSRHILDWVGDAAMIVWHDAMWKNFGSIEARYGVHASILEVTTPEALAYTLRIKDTSFVVRSRPHEALFRRHRVMR